MNETAMRKRKLLEHFAITCHRNALGIWDCPDCAAIRSLIESSGEKESGGEGKTPRMEILKREDGWWLSIANPSGKQAIFNLGSILRPVGIINAVLEEALSYQSAPSPGPAPHERAALEAKVVSREWVERLIVKCEQVGTTPGMPLSVAIFRVGEMLRELGIEVEP